MGRSPGTNTQCATTSIFVTVLTRRHNVASDTGTESVLADEGSLRCDVDEVYRVRLRLGIRVWALI